jgi:delta-aminolevulinic acid dehydratase/porphobilinogen synthase
MNLHVGQFPNYRSRRLRSSSALRKLVCETRLSVEHLVLPLFARAGRKLRQPVNSMPGVFQLSPDELLREAARVHALGVPAVLLFGIPDKKDAKASGAYAKNGIVQQTVRLLKKELPSLLVITDVCLCEYMEHGHCGIVHGGTGKVGASQDFERPSLKLLARTAASHAEAGADIVAPSDMMDGRVPRSGRRWTRTVSGHADHERMRRNLRRPFTGRSARPPSRRRSSATGAVTRWTRRTGTRRCARWRWTSRRGRTW